MHKAFDKMGREYWTETRKRTVPVQDGKQSGVPGANVRVRCFWCGRKVGWAGVHDKCWNQFKGQMLT